MDLTNQSTVALDKERLFMLYRTAITDAHGHIAGRRMVIAKEYKSKYNANIKADLLAINGFIENSTGYIGKMVKTVKVVNKVKEVIPPPAGFDIEAEFGKLTLKMELFEDKFTQQEEKYQTMLLEQKKDYNNQLELFRKQLKWLNDKTNKQTAPSM